MTINAHIISGNLTRDPEIRTSASGNDWATFTVAVNVRKKQGDMWVDVPSYFDCKAFGRLASITVAKLAKGSKVVVSGSMEQEAYTDKKSGEQRKAWRLVADEVVIMAGTAPIAGAGAKPEAYYEEPVLADEPLPF